MLAAEWASGEISDRRVIEAMRRVPREEFVAPGERAWAYEESALGIGEGQTISQPFIVALMTDAARLAPGEHVLEIGTGSGYQAAVLAELGAQVHSVERIEGLASGARATLARLGYAGVRVHVGDGSQGWPPAAPYDAIIVTAGAPEVPSALLAQLGPGGRLVIPVGPRNAERLIRVVRRADGYDHDDLGAVRFVPLVGAQGWSGPEA